MGGGVFDSRSESFIVKKCTIFGLKMRYVFYFQQFIHKIRGLLILKLLIVILIDIRTTTTIMPDYAPRRYKNVY